MAAGSKQPRLFERDRGCLFKVFCEEKFKRTMIFALVEDLREVLKKKVDVFEIGEVNPDSNFYKRIMKEKVLVA